MKTIGFPISHKENEKRRALVPRDLKKIEYTNALYFESGYGAVLGIDDEDYRLAGANIVSRESALSQDIICDPKIGDADYLEKLNNQAIFGWIHAVQNRDITDKIIDSKLTAYAWEDMFYEGRHIFWRNNELAGEAAVLHAFQCYGCMPYETRVAVIGRGNTARGSLRVLNMLGADVIQYDRKTENLLKEEISDYDVIVNCVLWDIDRKDHIISKNDLLRMKKNSMIIDVSCDKNGGIETSIPTTIENPIYTVDGIVHYVVDHSPAIYHKTFTYNNSRVIAPFIDMLVKEQDNNVLKESMCFKNGTILDSRIIHYQNRECN